MKPSAAETEIRPFTSEAAASAVTAYVDQRSGKVRFVPEQSVVSEPVKSDATAPEAAVNEVTTPEVKTPEDEAATTKKTLVDATATSAKNNQPAWKRWLFGSK
jgi:hypothetical protein